MQLVLSRYFNNWKYGIRIILLENHKSKQTEMHMKTCLQKAHLVLRSCHDNINFQCLFPLQNNRHSCTSLCFQFVLILPVHPYR